MIELEDVTIALGTPWRALPVGIGRKLDPRIAVAEALQLIGGFSDPQYMLKIAPQLEKFTDDGVFHGAYGQRVSNYDQLRHVIRRLTQDPDTRQAVLTLWDPRFDIITDEYSDYPCTVAIGFSIRRGYLNMRVSMRSNDVWLGLPYDMFQFAQLQYTLASILKVNAGLYTHQAWSLHMYEKDRDASYQLHELVGLDKLDGKFEYLAGVNTRPTIVEAQQRAREIMYNDTSNYAFFSRSEKVMRDVLWPHTEPQPAHVG